MVEIERFRRVLERRPRVAERVFSDGERAYAGARRRPEQHLAARFCAKEAVTKALGLSVWGYEGVEVVATARGPEVRLSGAPAARAAELGVGAAVSLTHSATMAAAAAILVPDR